jgi:hypothetical protein
MLDCAPAHNCGHVGHNSICWCPGRQPVHRAAHQAWQGLQLPQLERLIRQLTPLAPDVQDEACFSPPHERALGRALGLGDADGRIAFAALHAAQTGLAGAAKPGEGWAFVIPCHWQVRTDHVTLSDPIGLELGERRIARTDGLDGTVVRARRHGPALRTAGALAGQRRELLAEVATASLDRVVQRDVRAWLPPEARQKRHLCAACTAKCRCCSTPTR